MKKTAFLVLALFTITLINSENTLAQDSDYDRYDGLKFRKWRVTVVPPLSTNGTKTMDYTARYSINLIAGWHGGTSGIEYGTLFNYTSEFSEGIQVSGLANVTKGNMEGIQITGLVNYAGRDMSGIQISGLANYSKGYLEGLQFTSGIAYGEDGISGLHFTGIAGITKGDIEGFHITGGLNYAGGNSSGFQVAGLGNISGGDIEGLNASGVFNISKGNIEGLVASGAANIAQGDVEGLVATMGFNIAKDDVAGLVGAGVANIANDIEGLAAAGAFNYSNTVQGLQFAGGINFTKDLEGLQIGTLNYSTDIQGVQIGLVNFGNHIEGVPIGFLSYYSNGRKNFDIRAMDAGFTDIGINLGTYRVYNMILLGYNTSLPSDVYRIGWAIGAEQTVEDIFPNWANPDYYVNKELTIQHHFEGDFDRKLNLLWSYKYNLGKYIGDNFSIYAGPSLNMLVSRVDGSDDYTWYSIWSPSRKGRQYRFWVGATLGIRFFKQKRLPRTDRDYDWWF